MENDQFVITNDKMADWAVSNIIEMETERDRLIDLAEAKITDLNNRIEELRVKCDNDTKYLKSSLAVYFETVPTKETKTQRSYKLLSGTLVFKKPSVKIVYDDESLLKYLEESNDGKCVKIKKSIDWAEFKKGLTVADSGEIVDTNTGVVIPSKACRVEDVPASFTIKY